MPSQDADSNTEIRNSDDITHKVHPDILAPSTELGTRSTDEARLRSIYERMQPNFDLHSKIMEIRHMDQVSGLVRRVHHFISHEMTKGGLVLENDTGNKRLNKLWKEYQRNLGLNNRNKLSSDCRALVMEGNLVLQFVLNKAQTRVVRAIRMPAETIRAITNESGQFADLSMAFAQYDWLTGKDLATFARWQMEVVRLDPLNFDDEGEPGRPLLDASRKVWRQMDMTMDDLVIRRRDRAPNRTAHVLEGADDATLAAYKQQVESEQQMVTTNYYLNKKGGVQAVQGDANLDQVADINLLLDMLFAGTPITKGMFGFATDLSRDILQDMKEEFFNELDVLQDLQAHAYQQGFRLHLLVNGVNPDAVEWNVKFGERRTETRNQKADLGLKVGAAGASQKTVFEIMGLGVEQEEKRLKQQEEEGNPYPVFAGRDVPGVPNNLEQQGKPNVSITPGNAAKGESATSISNQ